MLGSILVQKGWVSHERLDEALAEVKVTGCASARLFLPGAGSSSPSSPPPSRSRPASGMSIWSATHSIRRRQLSCRSKLLVACSSFPVRFLDSGRIEVAVGDPCRHRYRSARASARARASTSSSVSARRSRTRGVTRLRPLSKRDDHTLPRLEARRIVRPFVESRTLPANERLAGESVRLTATAVRLPAATPRLPPRRQRRIDAGARSSRPPASDRLAAEVEHRLWSGSLDSATAGHTAPSREPRGSRHSTSPQGMGVRAPSRPCTSSTQSGGFDLPHAELVAVVQDRRSRGG